MKSFLALSMGMMIFAAPAAMAATDTMSTIPSNSVTVTDWYQQDVYDAQNNKIGTIDDVLVSPEGKVDALILSANGKDVAINFDSVKKTMKNDKVYLTMDTSKDALKSATTFKYDKNTTTWVLDTSKSATR